MKLASYCSPTVLNKESRLLAGLILVYLGTLTTLLFSVVMNLVVPLVCSKETFGNYRILVLYANYAGFLHLGILNGFYLRIVGRPIDTIRPAMIRSTQLAMRSCEVMLIVAGAAVWHLAYGYSSQELLLLCVMAAWIFTNENSLYTYLFQGTSLFRIYAGATVFPRLASVALVLLYITFSKPSLLILCGAFILPLILSNLVYRSLLRRVRNADYEQGSNGIYTELVDLKTTWSRGLVLYTANVTISLLFSLPGLFLSIVLPVQRFAEFAFAYGFASILYVGLDGLASAMTPHLSRSKKSRNRIEGGFLSILVIWLSPLTFWIASIAISKYYQKYTVSLPIVFVLMASMPLISFFRSRFVSVATACRGERLLLVAGVLGCTVSSSLVLAAWLKWEDTFAIVTAWMVGFVFLVVLSAGMAWKYLPPKENLTEKWIAGNALFACTTFGLVGVLTEKQWWGGLVFGIIALGAISASFRRQGNVACRVGDPYYGS